MKTDSHSIGQSVTLHLAPGALITAFYALTAPLVIRAGYPSLTALLLAVIFVLVPVELGILLYSGYRRNARLSLAGVIRYREPMPAWQYWVLIPVLLVWSFVWFILLTPLDAFLIERFFSWLPNWFFIAGFFENASQYSQTARIVTFLLALSLNGLVGPLVEELYFRGYLLPRIAYLGALAPLVNVLLFSLYHFFTPWQNLTRIVALLPLVFSVWWKRNIYISILTHIALNTIGVLLSAGLLFG